MKLNIVLVIISSAIFLVCCKPYYREIEILDKAENNIDTLPGDSYRTLQQIKNVEILPDSIQARYYYLIAKSALSSGMAISSDSGIKQAINFYRYKKDTTRLYKSLYYKALINNSLQNYTMAIEALKQSNKLLKLKLLASSREESPISNKNLSVLLANPVAEQRRMHTRKFSTCKTEIIKNFQFLGYNALLLKHYDEAIDYQENALEYARDLNDTAAMIDILVNLAESKQLNKKYKEAIEDLEEALKLSTEINDNSFRKTIFEQMYVIYEEEGKYEKAMQCLVKIRETGLNRDNIQFWNLTKAILYDKQCMSDSVYKYSLIAIKGTDPFVATVAYSMLAKRGFRQGRFAEALNYEKKINLFFDSFIRNLQSEKSRFEFEKERIKNENDLLKIKQKEKNLILLTIILVTLIILASLYIYYLKQKKKHIEQENLLLKQTYEISQLREKEAMLRESLQRRINLFRKFPSLSDKDINDESQKANSGKILLSENEWKEVMNDINEVYPHFTETLKKNYPKLNENDLRFCCLVKINVDLQDLSDIYCLSKGSITKKKYRLKKDKFGIDDPYFSLDIFLQKN